MKQFHTWLTAACALAGIFFMLPAGAQPPASTADRILFVVQTSRAMRERLPAARNCVKELVGSGLNGQLRAGDTIGLWTYDSELHAGLFPMQVWTEESRLNIAQAMGDYLSRQKARGQSQLKLALPEMLRVIGESEVITVLLITDGREAMQGTPFDKSVNEIFQLHRKELQDANQPFVTVLVARSGKIVKCNVNSAAGVNVPALPVPGETKPAQAGAESRAVPPAPASLPVKTNPPLIVDYSKSNRIAAANQHTVRTPRLFSSAYNNGKSVPPSPPVVVLETVPPPAIETSAPPEMPPPPPPITNPPVVAAPTTMATPPPAAESNAKFSTALPPQSPSNVPAPSPVAVAMPPTKAAAPAQVASPSQSVSPAQRSSLALVIFVAAALLLVGGLGWMLMRRRAISHTGGSLITKSFDRKKG